MLNNNDHLYDRKTVDRAELLGGALTTYDDRSLPRTHLVIDDQTQLVLVNPDRSAEHSIAKFVPSPYHGTWRLKHFLEERHSIRTAVVDPNIHDMSDVLKALADHQPPVIGFAFFYDSLEQDMANIWAVRKVCPDSLLIGGGIEATARAKEYVSKLPLDGILRGEGEYALHALMKVALDSRGCAKDDIIDKANRINGWYFKKSDGSIIDCGPALVINQQQYSDIFSSYNINIKDYEPYWEFVTNGYEEELLEVLDVNPKMVRLITANYCPYKCSFCVSTNFLNMASESKSVKVVGANAEDLYEKSKTLLSLDPDVFIYFDDENFMALPARAQEFCDLVISRGLQGSFGCRATAQLITEDICASMAKAGFRVVAFGAESWDSVALKDFNKRLENERSDTAIENIIKSGMKCSFNIILFAPRVTRDGLIETCDKVLKYIRLGCNVGITSYIAPYPGTLYFDNPEYYVVGGTLAVPGSEYVLSYPTAVLPSDPHIREAAERAQSIGKANMARWKTEYGWRHDIIPREVSCLALLMGTFEAMGVADSAGRRAAVADAVEYIFGNQRRRFVRERSTGNTFPTPQHPADGLGEALLGMENPY